MTQEHGTQEHGAQRHGTQRHPTQPSVLFVDNFDSFSFNLVDELRRRGCRVEVWRNDLPAERALELALALPAPRLIVLSPGPGAPADAGCCVALARLALGRVPLLGICLGHQALVEALGGEVGLAGEVVHGKASRVEHNERGLFLGLELPLTVGRYHSLAATRVPEDLEVTAWIARPGDDLVMAVEHRTHPMAGLQFHPESILTPRGGRLLENALEWARLG
jgi:anthranilate synthase component II